MASLTQSSVFQVAYTADLAREIILKIG